MWLISELEDEEKILSERFTVSSVPEIWLEWKGMRLWCYWPKCKNPLAKIKWAVDPRNSNSEKFSTHAEARKAEKMAQNYSTLSDYDASLNRKQKRQEKNESNTVRNKINRTANAGDVGDTVIDELSDASSSDVEIMTEEVIGNDSFEFNDEMKYGGDYLVEDELLPYKQSNEYDSDADSDGDVQSDENEKNDNDNYSISEGDTESDIQLNEWDEVANASVTYSMHKINQDEHNSPSNQLKSEDEKLRKVDSDLKKASYYSFNVGLKPDGILSSTPLEEQNSLQCNDRFNKFSDIIMNQVVGDANFELDLSPGPITNITRQRILSRIENIEANLFSFTKNVQLDLHRLKEVVNSSVDEHIEHISLSTLEYIPSKSGKENNPNIEVPKVQILSIEVLNASIIVNPIALVNDVNFRAPEASIIENPINTGSDFDFQAPESISKDNIGDDDYPVSDKNYELIEGKLEKNPYRNALIERSLPYDNETQSNYMDRIIPTLFNIDFFVDKITWRNEKERVFIEPSNILKCLKEIFEKNFGSDKDNVILKRHFRRIKSCRRAAKKAAETKRAKINRN